MGNNGSTVTHSSVSSVKAISEAYLSITQSVGQSVFTSQVVSVDCNDDPSASPCIACIQGLKKIWEDAGRELDLDFISRSCDFACRCEVKDINLDQQISVNFDAFQRHDNAQDFVTRVMDSLYSQAEQTGSSMFPDTNRTETIQKSITDVYTKMKSSTFMEAVQDLRVLQTVSLTGPGTIVTVDMTSA